ncbi:hypothetical protein PV646_28490 [Streptomyces sp. ID05-26A]|nr:hypothetical protein [Streptomyces sp. ID05-26A]
MTAITAKTLSLVAGTTERAVELIRNGPSISGSVVRMRVDCDPEQGGEQRVTVHLRRRGADEKDIAADLIAWFYLLNNAHTRIYGKAHGNVEVVGQSDGITYEIFTGNFEAGTKQYLRSLSEVTVHSLRRVQVGDVPEVVAA